MVRFSVQGDCVNNAGCANKPGVTLSGLYCTEAYLDEDSKDLRCCVTAIFDMFDLEQGADL